MEDRAFVVQASGGGDGSVRLWHINPAVSSTQNVQTTQINMPTSAQVGGLVQVVFRCII